MMKTDDIVKVRVGDSAYYFKLGKVLKDRNISKNKLTVVTNTDYKVIDRLMNGNLAKIDLDVLERLCQYLNCEANDIIELKRGIYTNND